MTGNAVHPAIYYPPTAEPGMPLVVLRPAGIPYHGPAAVTVTRILDFTSRVGALVAVPQACRVAAPHSRAPEATLVIRPDAEGRRHIHVSPVTVTSYGLAESVGRYVATPDTRWTELLEAELGHPFHGALAFHDTDPVLHVQPW